MIRLLLPSLIGLVSGIGVLWLFYYLIKSNIIPNLKADKVDSSQKILKTVTRILTLLSIVFYAIYVVNIISVNEIPRTEPDRSAQQEGKQNFEDRMTQDTITKR